MASLFFVGPFGLVVGPSVRFGQLTPPPRMCSEDLSPQPAAREPSLLTEISSILDDNMCGGMFLDEIRSEMVDAFVSVSGEPAPAAVGYGDKPMPTAEIGLEQLSSTSRAPPLAARNSPPKGPPEGQHWPWAALHSGLGIVGPALRGRVAAQLDRLLQPEARFAAAELGPKAEPCTPAGSRRSFWRQVPPQPCRSRPRHPCHLCFRPRPRPCLLRPRQPEHRPCHPHRHRPAALLPGSAIGASVQPATRHPRRSGDELPPEKVQAMFEAADDNGDGKIEFVKYFKAVMDEVSSRKKAESGGGGGGFLSGLFGR